jgi:hypothetical protein
VKTRFVTILVACVLSATACSSSDEKAIEATTTVAPTASTIETTTTAPHTGGQQALNCKSNEQLADDDNDGWGTCEIHSVSVDEAAALANATSVGLPAGITTCEFPKEIEVGNSITVVCRVVNLDGSEGTWGFGLNSDMTTTPPTYVETKARALTRADCTTTPPDGQFQKDSTAWTGQCLHFWAYVFQFDANTGPCSFLADYGSAAYNYNFKFSDAIIRVDGGRHCDLMGPVVESDMIEVWAVANGVESYSTTIGGSNTYTVFDLVDVTVYRHS